MEGGEVRATLRAPQRTRVLPLSRCRERGLGVRAPRDAKPSDVTKTSGIDRTRLTPMHETSTHQTGA
jgi:hypothetical protein